MSLRLIATTWLFNHSAIYRSIRESVALRHRIRARRERAGTSAADLHPEFRNLSSKEQQQYNAAASRLDKYVHTIEQIDSLTKLEGTRALFLLQPQLAVTGKPLTDIEKQLFDYWSKLEGPLDVYGFQSLYPQLSHRLVNNAAKEGYEFLDLTSVFDHVPAQTFTDYCHLTPIGNQAIADAIVDSFGSSFRQSTDK